MNARRVTAQALASLRDQLSRLQSVYVVAAGKAAVGMAQAAAEALGDRLADGVMTANVANSTDGGADLQAGASIGTDGAPDLQVRGRWRFFPSSHPLPNEASEAAGRAALELAGSVTGEDDLLLMCLSGGASAMLAVPAPGLTLEHKRRVNRALLRAGLDIGSMNIVRRHLSAIKGGQLAAAAARSITLAISDVTRPADDDPLTIGSGPTVGDSTTFADALRVIERAGIDESMPVEVMRHLRAGVSGRVAGPIAPDDPRLRAAAYWIVASRHEAMRAAADTARHIGYRVHVHHPAIGGEARHAPAALFDLVRGLPRPACVVASGETTVRVTGTGRGGRNQEVAVAALERLHLAGSAALASIGTDGIDGPTDAAGGIVDSEMWTRLGADPVRACAEALGSNDSYALLERLDALVKTGPTGTNVCDLQVLLLG